MSLDFKPCMACVLRGEDLLCEPCSHNKATIIWLKAQPTFSFARNRLLGALDERYREVRCIVADPEMVNGSCKDYNNVLDDLTRCLDEMIRLNVVEQEFKRKEG